MSYVRVSLLGSLSTEEVWSINPVFDPTGEFPGGVNQANLDAACKLIADRTIPTSLINIMSSAAKRNGARVEVRDDATDGLIALSIQASTVPASGTGAPALPFQNAVVISLRTDTPGASGRGRLYWPALNAAVGTTGRMTTPTSAAMVADAKTYLMGMASDLATSFIGITFTPAVRSRLTKTTPHITRIQVGNVIDTQRRRRDTLPESYSSATIP